LEEYVGFFADPMVPSSELIKPTRSVVAAIPERNYLTFSISVYLIIGPIQPINEALEIHIQRLSVTFNIQLDNIWDCHLINLDCEQANISAAASNCFDK
jgi:hypothetical protein